jgi:hypothetical protein
MFSFRFAKYTINTWRIVTGMCMSEVVGVFDHLKIRVTELLMTFMKNEVAGSNMCLFSLDRDDIYT